MSDQKRHFQLLWGAALVMMGIGLFFRIPQIMPRIVSIDYFVSSAGFIRICLYLVGIFLIVGGVKKLKGNLQRNKPSG